MLYKEKLRRDSRITILSLSWRDIKSPGAGGAEVQTHEMLRRVDNKKYRVIHLAPQYGKLDEAEEIDHVWYLRKGNAISVIGYAILYYKKNITNIDFVLDQCNTHRFFTSLWVRKSKRIFYIHQLTREIWDINLKFPLNKIGKFMETSLLKLNKKDKTIALSESTKQDLIDVGFQRENIKIIPISMKISPLPKEKFLTKEKNPTFIYVGRYVAYKGIDSAMEAFGILKQKYPNSKLWLLGNKNENYIHDKLLPICDKFHLSSANINDGSDIVYWGFVSEEKKLELLGKATALVFPSNREGWGIPISEAAYVGTPSIVYNTQGLRDAVNYGKAGYLCNENSIEGLLQKMMQVIEDRKKYRRVTSAAYDFSVAYLDKDIGKEFEACIKKIGSVTGDD